jgi:hypothetical protein
VDDIETVHHGHMPDIEITSPTTATGIWAMEDRLDGEWKIATLRLTRLRRDFVTAG